MRWSRGRSVGSESRCSTAHSSLSDHPVTAPVRPTSAGLCSVTAPRPAGLSAVPELVRQSRRRTQTHRSSVSVRDTDVYRLSISLAIRSYFQLLQRFSNTTTATLTMQYDDAFMAL